jgi:putative restriction endonuclease
MTPSIVYPTDPSWHRFLLAASRDKPLDEVNFWLPSTTRRPRIPIGAPVFFKLKAPHNAIGGYGRFASYTALPDWLAWECFGAANGTASYEALRERLVGIRSRNRIEPTGEIEIGCIMLAEPVFFDESDWIEQPNDWKPRTQSYRLFDIEQGEGLRIWRSCLLKTAAARADRLAAEHGQLELPTGDNPRYGSPILVRPRIGQGTFRALVTDAYEKQCAVSREHSLPVLEAAHIQPYASGGQHEVSNGLLLRTDIHRLYDKGFATVSPDGEFLVSDALRDRYKNGRAYYEMQGRRVFVPNEDDARPDRDRLAWHMETRFLGRAA